MKNKPLAERVKPIEWNHNIFLCGKLMIGSIQPDSLNGFIATSFQRKQLPFKHEEAARGWVEKQFTDFIETILA